MLAGPNPTRFHPLLFPHGIYGLACLDLGVLRDFSLIWSDSSRWSSLPQNFLHFGVHLVCTDPMPDTRRKYEKTPTSLVAVGVWRGVDNAVRTRDLLNHNQMLYLLSYIHHVVWNPTRVLDLSRFAQQRKLYMILGTCARRRVANARRTTPILKPQDTRAIKHLNKNL